MNTMLDDILIAGIFKDPADAGRRGSTTPNPDPPKAVALLGLGACFKPSLELDFPAAVQLAASAVWLI